MLIVIATHNVDNKRVVACICATEKIETAVRTARTAEDLGYVFHDPETEVSIFSVPVDLPIRSKGRILVYVRRREGQAWVEHWFDKLQERALVSAELQIRTQKARA